MKEYAECVNCLYKYGDAQTKTTIVNHETESFIFDWKRDFYPLLSDFHPSIFILAEKLQNVPHIKLALEPENPEV